MGARTVRAGLLAGALALAAFATPAQAANWLEMNFGMAGPDYSGRLPPCDWALGIISHRFAVKERRFWVSDLTIVSFDQVRETAVRPWSHDVIPRRYCSAKALLSNGRETKVHFWIGEGLGFAGMTWGVEWCVVGYDRNLAFAPRCKMAQP
jgi:hypothetical protein